MSSVETTCYECGKKFLVYSPSNYLYKVKGEHGHSQYLCSYTCFDHAKLRKEKSSLNFKKYLESVQRCEEAMVAKGKPVLHPLDKTPPSRTNTHKYKGV